MPTEKPKEDRVQKVKRTIDLDEALSEYIALAQEKRNRLVSEATVIAQNGEATLRSAVEKVFKKSEIEIPTAQVQIVKNPETGLASIVWEELAAKAEDGESESESEEPADEPEAEKSPVGVNGIVKRKLPAKG